MADDLTGVTQTVATAVDAISAQAQIYLQEAAVMKALVTDFSSLVVPGAKQVEIPKAPGFGQVDDKVENTAVDAQTLLWATDALALNKHKVIQWLVEKIASKQTVVAVVQEALLRASQDIANQMDVDIINILETASASNPDHRIAYVGGTIAEADILAGRRLLRIQKLSGNMMKEIILGISPIEEEAMLKISNFIDASKYGAGTPLFTGEIGKVFGVRVIVHNDIEDLKSLMWHPSAVGTASQFGPDFDSQKDLKNLGTRYSLDHLYGVKLLDGGKRVVMLGTGS